jgi:hypothetical protein
MNALVHVFKTEDDKYLQKMLNTAVLHQTSQITFNRAETYQWHTHSYNQIMNSYWHLQTITEKQKRNVFAVLINYYVYVSIKRYEGHVNVGYKCFWTRRNKFGLGQHSFGYTKCKLHVHYMPNTRRFLSAASFSPEHRRKHRPQINASYLCETANQRRCLPTRLKQTKAGTQAAIVCCWQCARWWLPFSLLEIKLS